MGRCTLWQIMGLSQSGLLATKLLERRLNKRGYYQSKLVPGLWKHERRPVQFTLVVDNFGVKYMGKEYAQHLKSTLEEKYIVTAEWAGTRYIGIRLDWNFSRQRNINNRFHAKISQYSENRAQF